MVYGLQLTPQLNGMPIIYFSNGRSTFLAGTKSSADKGFVAIEAVYDSAPATQKNSQAHASMKSGVPHGGPAPIVTNLSQLGPELIGLGISLAFTVVSAVGVAGGVAAEVPTGGASTVIVVASWTGLVTAGIQSANAAYRVGLILSDPHSNSLAKLDENADYSKAILIVDGLGVVSGFAALPFTVKAMWPSLKQLMKLRKITITEEAFAKMNRVERGRLVRSVLEQSKKDPAAKIHLKELAKSLGMKTATLDRDGSLSKKNAVILSQTIGKQASTKVKDAIKSYKWSAAGAGASAMPSSLVGSASGSVNYSINNPGKIPHYPQKITSYVVHIFTPDTPPRSSATPTPMAAPPPILRPPH
jgi:hypothetical protein